MPKLLRKTLGIALLITTVGLSTCQSMVEAEPGNSPPELSNQVM